MKIRKLIMKDSFKKLLFWYLLPIRKTTLYNVCAVPWGVFSTVGDIMSTMGDILSTVGVFSIMGDIMINVGISWVPWGVILSTMGDVQYHRGISWCTWGHHEYRGGCLVPWGDTILWNLSTMGGYHDACGRISWVPWGCSVPWGTQITIDFPPQYWTPSTVLMISPTCIMISPMVLNIPHSTQDNPPQYSWYPHGTEHPHGTQDIPPWYWTPPWYSRYPPRYSWYPPRYWTPPTVLKTPTVLHTHYTGWKRVNTCLWSSQNFSNSWTLWSSPWLGIGPRTSFFFMFQQNCISDLEKKIRHRKIIWPSLTQCHLGDVSASRHFELRFYENLCLIHLVGKNGAKANFIVPFSKVVVFKGVFGEEIKQSISSSGNTPIGDLEKFSSE